MEGWEYHRNPQRWTLRNGGWYALVQAVEGYRWRGLVERAQPRERYEGPAYEDPEGARAWCVTKIAELRTRI